MSKTKKLKTLKEGVAKISARLQEVKKLEEMAKPSLSMLLENDLDKAELVLAAQDIMNKLQVMAEDLAKLNAQDLFPLVDKMKSVFGQAASHAFEATTQEVLNNAMNSVRNAKDELGNAILRLEGDIESTDMASDESEISYEPVTDPVDQTDDFGGAEAASGPENEPLGRAKKESIQSKPALTESQIFSIGGAKLLETETIQSLISWMIAEAAETMPDEKVKTFAAQLTQKAAADPIKLAGWIGSKKHGMAAMAQLAEPTFTQVGEGKSFKYDPENEDDKKGRFTSRKDRRREKESNREMEVTEGKSFKYDPEDDSDKNEKFRSRKNKRKEKEEEHDSMMEHVEKLVNMIESNIKSNGRGKTHQVIEKIVSESNIQEADLVESFKAKFGTTPAQYSTKLMIEGLSAFDQKKGTEAIQKMTQDSTTDISKQPLTTGLNKLDASDRAAAQKVVNDLAAHGKKPNTVGDLVNSPLHEAPGQKAAKIVMDHAKEQRDACEPNSDDWKNWDSEFKKATDNYSKYSD